jgi:hypothetical protein
MVPLPHEKLETKHHRISRAEQIKGWGIKYGMR